MTETWFLAALWLGLALIATLFSIWLRVATALSEIVVGTVAQLIIGATIGTALLHTDDSWIKFLSGTGAIVLTFLAGAELDPAVFRTKWKEACLIGLVGFVAPFFGCTALAYWVLHWDVRASWLAGVAMSTTSVAVVYAVMLEFGLNVTSYGKTILAACFINDLLTVLALGFIFSPFTWKTGAFFGGATAVCVVLPFITPRFFKHYGGRPSELEAKFLLLMLFGLGGLATWSGSEAVLPAYHRWHGAGRHGGQGSLTHPPVADPHLRPTHTVSTSSERARSYRCPRWWPHLSVLLLILLGKMVSKCIGVFPPRRLFKAPTQEAIYTTLLMSTGLTFGTISSLFGLSHGVITRAQYSALVAAVVASAVVPTLIANAFFLPRHLLRPKIESEPAQSTTDVLPTTR